MTSPTKETQTLRTPHLATASVVALAGQPIAKLMYEAFQSFNTQLFAGQLAPGLVLITQAKSSRTWGDYIKSDVHGLESRIRIAPSAVKRGALFALDVLVHEMVHAWQEEVDGDGEDGYRGHGPRFAAKCNQIGEALGLPRVGVKGRDGLPDCAQWPMNVRPAGYYPDPYIAPTRTPKAPPRPAPERGDDSEPTPGNRLAQRLAAFVGSLGAYQTTELQEVGRLIALELASRHQAPDKVSATVRTRRLPAPMLRLVDAAE